MFKRRIKAIALFAAVTLTPAAAVETDILSVNGHNGEGWQTELSSVDMITFGDTGFTLHCADASSRDFAYDDVLDLKLLLTGAGVGEIVNEERLVPVYENGMLSVKGYDAQSDGILSAAITDISGRVVWRSTAWDGTAVETSCLVPGVYVFSVNGTSLKFCR